MNRTVVIARQCRTSFFHDTIKLNFRKTATCFLSTDNRQNEKKNSLYRHLYSKILSCGPISVADYMKEILLHPSAGYYMTNDVFGSKGDFTTSPEISQLFGEMVALWIISEYKKITNTPFQIIELGPGRGTMIKDILRIFARLKYSKNISVHLVEVSPTLSDIQAKNLCTDIQDCSVVTDKTANTISYYKKGITKDGTDVYWYYSVKDIPRQFSVFLAHEFFDALPIHKFQKTESGWREILIDVTKDTDENKFRYVLSPSPTPATHAYVSKNESRLHVEISPETMVVADYIAQFLWECGGFGLIIDYGHIGDKSDTFRAYSKHKQEDPLTNPGTMDLTADVDFSIIKRIVEKDDRLITFGPTTQSRFLKTMGINVRLQRLMKNVSSNERAQLESGYRMIMEEMGTCFKVLALFPSILKEHLQKWPVAGFSETCKGDNVEIK